MIYRRRPRIPVLAAVLLLIFSGSSSAGDLVHQVVKGETVYSISRLYKISQEELMRYNNIADASKLQLGMKLAIPSRENSPPALTAVPYTEYIVSKDDTLYSIARSWGVTLQALRDINGFSKNYILKAGEKIKIPGAIQAATAIKPVPVKHIENTAQKTSVKKADASLRWPVAAREVQYMTSNSGVLVSGRESESIKSLTGGIVVHASPWRGYGNVAVVETEDGYRYLYGACETLSVRKGDNIEPGTELGKLGIYPASGKPELVLIVSQNGSPVDPAKAPRF
ncbi:MAG: M23 family metallopeptidase [Treponema sp.]|jgi:LysM repeat protein|nr:M23 family metallopeptidase [Treponema sp.]